MRSDFLQRWREQGRYNPRSRDASAFQEDGFLRQALDRYSRLHPRENLEAELDIVADQTYVVLPLDISMRLTPAATFAELIDDFASIIRVPSFASYGCLANNPAGWNPPFSGAEEDIETDLSTVRFGRREVDGRMRDVWLLPFTPSIDDTATLIYTGLHMVEDANVLTGEAAINTLDPSGEMWVLEQMDGYYLRALGNQAQQYNPKQAAEYFKQAEAIFLRGDRIAPVTV